MRTIPLSKRVNRVDCFVRDADTGAIIDMVVCVSKPLIRYRVEEVFERIRNWARNNNVVVGVEVRGQRLYVPHDLRATDSLLQKYNIEVKHRLYEEDDEEDF